MCSRSDVEHLAPAAPSRLELYRVPHVIQLAFGAQRCAFDGIPIIPRSNGWRHDPDTIRSLAAIELEDLWP